MIEDKFGKPADYLTGMSFVQGVHYNVGQQVIITTEDKLFRPLSEWKKVIEARQSWAGPVPLFLALLLSLITSDTKDKLGISKETWGAVFLILTAAAGLWTIYALYQLLKKATAIDDVIAQIKNSQQSADPPRVTAQMQSEAAVVIETARYGAAGQRFFDVKAVLSQRLAASGTLAVVASNDLAGDPCYGFEKELVVSYYFDGKHLTKTAKEGESLLLP